MMRRVLSVALCLAMLTVSPAPAQARGGGHRGDWPTWQGNTYGVRHNAAERQLTPDTVGGLKLKWAFAYPKQAGTPRSQLDCGSRMYATA